MWMSQPGSCDTTESKENRIHCILLDIHQAAWTCYLKSCSSAQRSLGNSRVDSTVWHCKKKRPHSCSLSMRLWTTFWIQRNPETMQHVKMPMPMPPKHMCDAGPDLQTMTCQIKGKTIDSSGGSDGSLATHAARWELQDLNFLSVVVFEVALHHDLPHFKLELGHKGQWNK